MLIEILLQTLGMIIRTRALPLDFPDLPNEFGIDHPDVEKMFPSDAIARARQIKDALDGHGTGAYTHSQGPLQFRQEICDFIEERDDLKKGSVDPKCIFMTNGASSGIEMILNTLMKYQVL